MKLKSILTLSLGLGLAYGQTCKLPSANQWRKNLLTDDLAASVAFSITKNKDVFIAEMISGKVKMYEDATSRVVDLGKVDEALYTDNGRVIENGFLGIAADPNYAENNWIYAFYSKRMSDNTTTDCRQTNVYDHKHILARFTVENNQLTNRKEILSFQRWSTSHAAGGMDFDRHGNLYISTGDDSNPHCDNGRYGPRGTQGSCNGRPESEVRGVNALETSANTNNLKGKTLRIKPIPFADSENPDEGVGSTYEIPEGNLFDEAEDTDNKTRPEIYTMGHRNPYHLRVDEMTGWVFIGEVGPDGAGYRNGEPQGYDEFNLATEPGNFGWPFAVANNEPYKAQSSKEGDYSIGQFFDLENLQNKSPANTGLVDLLPATPALSWYTRDARQEGIHNFLGDGSESAIGGPRYWYDADGEREGLSPNRMPPYFQGKFIGGDWARGKIWAFDVDTTGTLKKIEAFQPDNSGNPIPEENSLIDMDLGPDGVLYVLYTGGFEYSGWQSGGSLARYEYTGSQYDISECAGIVPDKPDTTTGIIDSRLNKKFGMANVNFGLKSQAKISVPAKAALLRVFNLRGENIKSIPVSGKSEVQVNLLSEGMYYGRFE